MQGPRAGAPQSAAPSELPANSQHQLTNLVQEPLQTFQPNDFRMDQPQQCGVQEQICPSVSSQPTAPLGGVKWLLFVSMPFSLKNFFIFPNGHND